MIYNTLADYRDYIASNLAPSTATTYYYAMYALLNDQYILDCKDLDISKILAQLENLKHKNTFSKHKNAFFKFCDFINLPLSHDVIQTIETMNDDKIKKNRKLKPVRLDKILKAIKYIRDKKLKLSFQTLLATGLRVSELSQIKESDSIVNDDTIYFRFIGKGGKSESVNILKTKNPNLYNNLIIHINSLNLNDKVFYSSSHLQKEATKRGFACHDLRRAFAKLSYQEYKDIGVVKALLRHQQTDNTKIYLKSKVDI